MSSETGRADKQPENIMLVTRQGDRDFVKVLDFGLAKVASVEPGGDDPAQSLTKHGSIFGTPKYMAPEQCIAGAVDGRADLYALGLILFEMLTGVQAFSGTDALKTITMQLTAPMPTIKSVAPQVQVPESLEAVVRRLTEKQPEQRYANASELLTALALVVEKEGLQQIATATAVTPVGLSSAGKEESRGEQKTIHSVEVISENTTHKESLPPPTKPTLPADTEPTPKVDTSPSGSKLPVKESPRVEVPAAAARTLDTLYKLHQGLPSPLRKIPLPGLIGACCASVVLSGIILIGATSDKPKRDDKSASQATVSVAMLEDASRSGIPALVALAEEYPADARVRRTIAQLLLADKKGLEALRYLGKAAQIDAKGVSEDDVRQATSLALSVPESVDEAVTLLETDLGAVGVDVLYSLSTRPGLPRAKQTRLSLSLSKPSVRAHASPSLAVTLDLRSTSKCEAKRSLLKRAAEQGDERTLDQLKPLTVMANCGPLGLLDCWPCLHNDKQLTDTINAIETRLKNRK